MLVFLMWYKDLYTNKKPPNGHALSVKWSNVNYVCIDQNLMCEINW